MVHSSSEVKLAKSAGQPGQLFRLEDMNVEEVSLVDRAANKRSFLVIKRGNGSNQYASRSGGGSGGAGKKPMSAGARASHIADKASAKAWKSGSSRDHAAAEQYHQSAMLVHQDHFARTGDAASGKAAAHHAKAKEAHSNAGRPGHPRTKSTTERDKSMGSEVRANGKGGFTKTMRKAAFEVPPGFKEMVSPLLTKAGEMLDELTSQLGSAKPAEVGDDGSIPGVPAEWANGVATIMGLLDKAMSLYPAAPPEPEEGMEEDPEFEDPTGEPTEMQMRMTLDNVSNVLGGEVSKALKSTVLKVGAKMSKERFTRLQQSYQVLGTLISELAPSAAAPAPTGAPPIGKAKDDEDEKDKKKAAKADASSAAVLTAIQVLTEQVGKIAGVVKSQGAALQGIQKSRSAPASAQAETQQVTKSADAFSWPMDMANPINRDTVDKRDGFFDED